MRFVLFSGALGILACGVEASDPMQPSERQGLAASMTAEAPSFILGDDSADDQATSAGLRQSEASKCVPKFAGIVRDFKSSHPDFQSFSGASVSQGMVKSLLGADRKPVYNNTHQYIRNHEGERAYFHPRYSQQTTSDSNFAEWYNDVDDVNLSYEFELPLQQLENDRYVFDSSAFFPIDAVGWAALEGDSEQDNAGVRRNFWFTFELHTEVSYAGGEVFLFSGDDDLWVFINGKLALDLGGVHPPVDGKLDLDAMAGELGLKRGQSYPLDLFHAERRAKGSNFRVETSLQFTNCEPIFVDPPPTRLAR